MTDPLQRLCVMPKPCFRSSARRDRSRKAWFFGGWPCECARTVFTKFFVCLFVCLFVCFVCWFVWFCLFVLASDATASRERLLINYVDGTFYKCITVRSTTPRHHSNTKKNKSQQRKPKTGPPTVGTGVARLICLLVRPHLGLLLDFARLSVCLYEDPDFSFVCSLQEKAPPPPVARPVAKPTEKKVVGV